MKKLDTHGSIVPVVIFFVVLLLIGLLHGVFTYMIDASQTMPDIEVDVGGGNIINVNTGMNTIMGYAWALLVIIVLVVAVSWLLMTAQKERWGGGP